VQSVFNTMTIEQLAEPAFKTQFAADYTSAFAALAGVNPYEVTSLDVHGESLMVVCKVEFKAEEKEAIVRSFTAIVDNELSRALSVTYGEVSSQVIYTPPAPALSKDDPNATPMFILNVLTVLILGLWFFFFVVEVMIGQRKGHDGSEDDGSGDGSKGW